METKTDSGITLDSHLESFQAALHELRKAHNLETLTPEAMAATIGKLASNFRRDFPASAGTPEAAISEQSIAELLPGYWQRIQVRKNAGSTGITGLNKALNGGFQAKRLVVLLGAPGSGKTSLANQMAEHTASERPVLYVTSEDTPDVLLAKTIARIGQIKYSAVLYGWSDYETAINRALQEMGARPSAQLLRYLDVTGNAINLEDIKARARAHFEGKNGPGLIVIDYLQRLARSIRDSAGIKELREAVTFLTEQLRAIACDLDCTVLALAAMHRASGYGKNSDASALSSAKESGDIEYTADVIMSLAEDSNRRTSSDMLRPRVLRIDKNRQGETTTIELDWYADRQQFTEPYKDR